MPTDELLVVTCASGRQCKYLLPLLKDHFRLRLVVHTSASQERLQTLYPAAEVVRADLASAADCQRIVAGATAVYYLSPPFHPFERQCGFNMIDAAAAAAATGGPGAGTLRHFVLSSVLWSQLHTLRHHAQKCQVEEYLIESPLRCWTILAPTHFIDLIPVRLLATMDAPAFPMMWSPDTLMSFVALVDLAAVAARVLRERERHFYAHYPLASTAPVTYAEVLGEVGRQVGKEVRVEKLGFEDSVRRFMKLSYGNEDGEGVHPTSKMAEELMLLHYRHYGLVGNTNVAEWLLGRRTTGYAEWIRGQLAETSK